MTLIVTMHFWLGLQPLAKALKYGGDYVSSAVVHDRYYVTGQK